MSIKDHQNRELKTTIVDFHNYPISDNNNHITKHSLMEHNMVVLSVIQIVSIHLQIHNDHKS
jgi:hypothetical protein